MTADGLRSYELKLLAKQAVTVAGALQKPVELAGLLARAESVRPSVIVEIGSDVGGTLYAWRAAFATAHVAGISLPFGSYSTLAPLNAHGATVIEADSHDPETRSRLVSWLAGKPIDVLFIDGDHSYEGVSLDFEMYAPLVRIGGLVCFHDIVLHFLHAVTLSPFVSTVGVHRLWRELPGRKHELVGEPSWWGGIGIVEVSAEVIEETRAPKLRVGQGMLHEAGDIYQQNVRELFGMVDAMRRYGLNADLARRFGDDATAMQSDKLRQEARYVISRMTRRLTVEDLAAMPEALRSAIEEAREVVK